MRIQTSKKAQTCKANSIPHPMHVIPNVICGNASTREFLTSCDSTRVRFFIMTAIPENQTIPSQLPSGILFSMTYLLA